MVVLASCELPTKPFVRLGFGNLGGVIAGFVYRSNAGPRFFSGHGLLIATTTMSLILSFIMHTYLKRENARRDAAAKALGLHSVDDYTEEMRVKERDMGDNATVRPGLPFLPLQLELGADFCNTVLPVYRLEELHYISFIKTYMSTDNFFVCINSVSSYKFLPYLLCKDRVVIRSILVSAAGAHDDTSPLIEGSLISERRPQTDSE